jgi:hypothetical protein
MLNFNKKKYVSFDNLSKFSGMIQKALSDKLKNVETNLNEKIDSRFKSLTAKEQGDSEVIDAREGQVSLSENLKTYVKKEEHENLDNKISNQIEEIKTDILTMSNEVEVNTEYINTNKSAIQRVIDFVNSFRCEFSLDETGHIKFPAVLGGLLVQWGRVENTPGKPEIRINLPVVYPERMYGIQFTGQWGHSNHHYWVSGNTDYRTFITPVKIGSQDVVNVSDPVYWFTFGR